MANVLSRYRKTPSGEENGVIKWKLTPLYTDEEQFCCGICVKENEMAYFQSIRDVDGQPLKKVSDIDGFSSAVILSLRKAFSCKFRSGR